MRDLALDTTDGDLYVGDDQELALIDDAEEVGQAAAICLRAHEREYFLDQNLGPDHSQKVTQKPYNKAAAESHIASKLRTVQELRSVTQMDLTPSGTTVGGTVAIDSIYGPVVVTV
jgi:hypothetical protein